MGDYYGSGTATIAGGRTVPIILVRGYKDVLRKRYYTFVYDEVIRNDGISILGEIATKDYPLDLSELTLNIAWGETPFTLEPDQAVPLRRIGGERFFYYDASEALSLVYFDLERGYYQIEIRQSLLAKPPQDFSITMTDANNTVVFDESVPVP